MSRGVVVCVVALLASPPALADEGELTPLPPIETNVIVSFTAGVISNLEPPDVSPIDDDNALGVTVAAELGYRFRPSGSVGIHAGIGTLSGSYDKRARGIVYETVSYGMIPIELGAFLHMRPMDRLWGGFLAGLHVDGARFYGETTWSRCVGAGLEVGYDFGPLDSHWLSLVFRATASFMSDVGYGSVGVGIAYRR